MESTKDDEAVDAAAVEVEVAGSASACLSVFSAFWDFLRFLFLFPIGYLL